MKGTTRQPGRYRSRGVMIYATTLMTSVTIVGAGITLVSLQTADRQLRANLLDGRRAHWTAHAGLEWVLMYADRNDDWRTGLDGVTTSISPHGDGGVVTISVSDGDGNLGDDDRNPAVVQAAAVLDDLNYIIEIAAQSRAHPAFAYGLFAANSITLCNARIDAAIYAGTLILDQCAAVTATAQMLAHGPSGTSVSASLVSFASTVAPIPMPQPDVNFYLAQATAILPGGDLQDVVLSPTTNTRGAANANGVYWLDIAGLNVTIKDVSIRGTLIITGAGGNSIKFKKGARVRPGLAEYPTLLILVPSAAVSFEMTENLDETSRGLDFSEDGDTLDVLTSEITGVVWAPDTNMELQATPWTFDGVAMAKTIAVRDGVTVTHKDSFTAQLMPGFTDKKLYPVPGTARVIMP